MGVPDGVARDWRRTDNEELHDLYSSPDIIRVNKLRRIRWEWQVARMGDRKVNTGFWWGDLRERNFFGGPGVEGRIILKTISRKWDVA